MRLLQSVRPDPLQQLMERFAPLGFNREDVSLAMTALGGPDNVTDDQVRLHTASHTASHFPS